MIGADGVKSVIRQRMVGDPVRVTGHVVYRAVVERDNMPEELRINAPVLWAGPHCHLVHYPLRGGQQYNLVVTFHSREQEEWGVRDGSKEEVLSYFQAYTRARTRCWTGPLRGSAGHRRPRAGRALGPGTRHAAGRRRASMTQYMAQGACMALEDAVTLGEAVRACGHDLERLPRYESVRIPRSAAWSGPRARWAGCITRAASNAPCAIAVDRPQPVPVPGRVAMALRLESGAMPRGTHPAIKTGTGGDDMKHASTRGAVRIAATPAANASRRAVRRVAASAVTLLALYAHAAGAQQNPWTSVSSARCPRPPAIGEDERDAFMLAVQEGGGKLGGCRQRASRMTRSPANAKQSADRMVQSGVRLFTGVNFRTCWPQSRPPCSTPAALRQPERRAVELRRPRLQSQLFLGGVPERLYADTAGMAANDLGARRVVVMAPNYQAGRDAVAGFKRAYKGEIVEEIYTKLDQSDFSVELARIRSLRTRCSSSTRRRGHQPDQAVRQFRAGRQDQDDHADLPMDDRMLAATGSAGKGFYLSSLWSADLDNPQNKHFVDAFTKAYKRAPPPTRPRPTTRPT